MAPSSYQDVLKLAKDNKCSVHRPEIHRPPGHMAALHTAD